MDSFKAEVNNMNTFLLNTKYLKPYICITKTYLLGTTQLFTYVSHVFKN